MLALNSGTISAQLQVETVPRPIPGPLGEGHGMCWLAEEEDFSKLYTQGFAWGHAQGETSKAVLQAR